MRFASLTPVLLLLSLLACNGDKRPVLNGRVEAYLTDLSPQVGGRLVEVEAVEGQRVKKGDLLARISAEELDAAVAQASAAVRSAEAKRLELANGTRPEDVAQGRARVSDAQAQVRLSTETLNRATSLFADGAVSKADLDAAQSTHDRAVANLHLQEKSLAELEAGARKEERMGAAAEAQRARAALRESRTQAGYTEIRAPFDGLVVHRLREVGSTVAPGQPVVTLARLDSLWVRVYVPQPLQAQASIGMPVSVQAGDRTFQAVLNELSSEAEYTPKMVETREERVNLVYPARVEIPKGWDLGLLPGLAVDVRLGLPPKEKP